MVWETLLLLCSIPQLDGPAKVVKTDQSSVCSHSPNSAPDLPVAPEPKAKPEAEPAALRSPAEQPWPPARPAITPAETPRQRKMWYALTMLGSGGAAFDAWSTRRAVSGGYGQEANPFLRPFANSNLLYAATQVSPALLDFLGKRLMTNEHRSMRRVWWLPQTVGASFSFVAGTHNVRVVP